MAGAALWASLCVAALLVGPSSQQYGSNTPCFDARNQQGPPIPGRRHHDCDASGAFKPQQCLGSRCFCVDPLGGQMTQFEDVGRHEAHLVSCGCARQKSEHVGRHIGTSVTCDSRGNFEPRQCVGSQCHCVDALTGEKLSNVEAVHVSQITQLDCGPQRQQQQQPRRHYPPPVTAPGGDTPCWTELRRHEQQSSGPLGAARPDCDRMGRYAPKQCRGSKCFCVAPDGRRLETYQMAPREKTLFCGCARRVHEISESGLVGVILSCDDHGDYNPKQCVGSVCHCADHVTGEKHQNSAQVPIHQMDSLDCSAHHVGGEGQKLPRLLGGRTPCWDELRQHEARSTPLLGAEKPNCDRTGRYHPKQCKGSECFCVDPYNGRLSKYRQPRSAQSAAMGCLCSRREWELQQGGLLGLSVVCDELGNFAPQQCVGSSCHCVETLSGAKLPGSQTHVSQLAQLDCEVHRRRLLGGDRPCEDARQRLRPGDPQPECDRAGKFAPVQCSGTTCRCVGPAEQELKGYEQPIQYRERMSCVCARRSWELSQDGLGHPVTCDKYGGFHSHQCEGSTCYCVDPASGQPEASGATVHVAQLASLRCGGQQPLLGGQQPCWEEKRRLEQQQQQAARPLLGLELPRCDRSGRFEPTQCRGSGCYCVDAAGAKLDGYSAGRHEEQHTHCVCARLKHETSSLGLIGPSRNCNARGNFERVQCHGSQCFCVDPHTGGQVSERSVHVGQLATLDCSGSGGRQLQGGGRRRLGEGGSGTRQLLGGSRQRLGEGGSGTRQLPDGRRQRLGEGGSGTRQLLGGQRRLGEDGSGTRQFPDGQRRLGEGGSGIRQLPDGRRQRVDGVSGTRQLLGSGRPLRGGGSGSGHSGGPGYPGGSGHSGGSGYPGGSGQSGGAGFPGGSGQSGGFSDRPRLGEGGSGIRELHGGGSGSGHSGGPGYPGGSGQSGGSGHSGGAGYPGGSGQSGGSGHSGGAGYPGGSGQSGGSGHSGGAGYPGGSGQSGGSGHSGGAGYPGGSGQSGGSGHSGGAGYPGGSGQSGGSGHSGGAGYPGGSGQSGGSGHSGGAGYPGGSGHSGGAGGRPQLGEGGSGIRELGGGGRRLRGSSGGGGRQSAARGGSTPCWEEKTRQMQYKDQGQSDGAHLPECDRGGKYMPKQCQGSQCRCVDPDGNTIENFVKNIWDGPDMNCQCARRRYELSLSGQLGTSAVCNELGNFETHQCTGSQCICVDHVTGERLPDTESVHASELSRLERSCPRLGANHPCWDERQRLTAQSGGRPLRGASQPECDLYGQYANRQCKGSQCSCVTSSNEPIEGYSAPIGRSAEMHCQCARREWELRKQRLLGHSVRCDELGNYQPQQCTGSSCYQVDTETGRQVQQATGEQQRLPRSCDQRARRLAGTDSQPVCDRDGTFAPRQCRGGACFCVDPAGNQLQYRSRTQDGATCHCARREYELRANSVRGMTVRCDERGDYQPVQCLGSECHCVERATGHWRREVPARHVGDIEKLNCGAVNVQPAY